MEASSIGSAAAIITQANKQEFGSQERTKEIQQDVKEAHQSQTGGAESSIKEAVLLSAVEPVAKSNLDAIDEQVRLAARYEDASLELDIQQQLTTEASLRVIDEQAADNRENEYISDERAFQARENEAIAVANQPDRGVSDLESVRALDAIDAALRLSGESRQNGVDLALNEPRGADIIAAHTEVFQGINITA